MDDAIRAFMTFLQLEHHASHETVRGYGSDLRQFQAFMTTEHPDARPLDPAAVQTESIRAYLHWLNRKHEKSTSMARKLASLRSFYRYLQRAGKTALNPAEAIRTPKQPKHLPRVLTKDDAAALMEFAVDQTGSSLRDRALLETLYSTGARVSELVGINLEDLRASEGLVHLRGKGRKEQRDRGHQRELHEHHQQRLQQSRIHRGRLERGPCRGRRRPPHVTQHRVERQRHDRQVHGQREDEPGVLPEDERGPADRLREQAVDAAPLHLLRHEPDADEHGDEQPEHGARGQTEIFDDLDLLAGGELGEQE